MEAIPDFGPADRPALAEALGQLGNRRATPAVIKILEELKPGKDSVKSEDVSAVCAVLRALSALGDSTATERAAAAERAGSGRRVERGGDAGRAGRPASGAGVDRALASGEPRLVAVAARALGQIRDPRAVAPLIAALNGPAAKGNERSNVAGQVAGRWGSWAIRRRSIRWWNCSLRTGVRAGNWCRGQLLAIHDPHVIVAVADHLAETRPMYNNGAAAILEELTGHNFRFSRDRLVTWWRENRAYYVAQENNAPATP